MHVDYKISRDPFFGLSLKTFPVVLWFLLAGGTQDVICQVKEDFSDTDLTSNPTWSGTLEDFRVNENNQLQLNASAAGESWLSTYFEPESPGTIQWQFLIGQSFAPSGSNFSRFYLISDQQNLSGPLNGYYLQFGEAGSSDAVELFYQSGLTTTSLCRAEHGTIATSFTIRVHVSFSPPDKWELSIDYSGGEVYTPEAIGLHRNTVDGAYFGVFCRYTISNTARFLFDDVSVRAQALPDTGPPQIDSVRVKGPRSLIVFFSEPLDPPSVVPENFAVTPHPGPPTAATLIENVVELSFDGSFANGVQSTLHASAVRDLFGNSLSGQTISFLFLEESPVSWKDVIITEIFPDPTPSTGLPEAEFVELYNRSVHPINLSGWHLADPATSAQLPDHILLSQHYAILAGVSAANRFDGYADVLPLTRFPSLNNTGDAIVLIDDDGEVIDSVRYSSTWYGDEDKYEGGWSLELIDPDDVCRGDANWTASESPEGGTPGSRNSVHASRPDNTGPRMESVICIDSMTLLISFNEMLNDMLPSIKAFDLDGGLEAKEVAFAGPLQTGLVLTLTAPVLAGKKYTLMLGDIFDCPGNRIHPDHGRTDFLLPEEAKAGDIIINELLFNPRSTGVDFIEVYNRSSKIIDLHHWSLRNWLSPSSHAVVITRDHVVIYPGQFLVFTENTDVLKGEYVMAHEESLLKTDIPALNDDEGSVTLLDAGSERIDSVYYSDIMHSSLLKDDQGVSLERISESTDGTESANWRSASSVSGFATPGYTNSNARRDQTGNDESIIVEPEVVQQQVALYDFAKINYRFEDGGLIGNVRIFDHQGRSIRTIADNEVLGTEGFFRWDGNTDNGSQVATGYYMVWFEVFSVGGDVKTFRKRVAVF